MPPRRTPGRHRKPKHGSGSAYVTAATLAAFAVSGVNVPGAIGASRDQASSEAVTQQDQRARVVAAAALRRTLVQQNTERASRLRAVRTTMVNEVRVAAEAERKAREAAEPDWLLPLASYRLTAGFGEWGLWANSHTGQDFAAPQGTPIRAIGDGTVVSAGWDGPYGYKVAIEHPDGTVTWYAHMSRILRFDGAVRRGQVIGLVGATGNVTGPHVHLEVRPGGGDPVPPLTWLRARGVAL